LYYSKREPMQSADQSQTPPGCDATNAAAADVSGVGSAPGTSAHRSPNAAQAILLGSALGQLGIALLVTIYLARSLSPTAFGFFSLVGTVFILARKFLDLGLSNVAARDIAQDPRRERPILEGMMAYRRAAGFVLAVALFVFAFLQKSEPERSVLIMAGLVMLFTAPAALDPVFQVRQAQGGPALLNLFGGLLVLLGSIVFSRLAVAGAAFALLLVIREAMSLLFTKVLAERLLGYRPHPGFRGRHLETFVGPALVFGLASLIYTIYFNCDVFFVLALRGRDELGAYAAAFRPINPLLLLPWLLMVPMVPVLTATVAKDRDMFVRQVRSASAIAVGIGATGMVAGVLLAPDLVELLYRGRYLTGALSTVNAFRWLAVALGLVCVTTVLTASMLADRREKVLLTIGTVALVANVALNVVLLRRYNFTAAGFATAVTELLFFAGAAVTFFIGTRRSPMSWNSLIYLLPAVVMGVLLRVVHGGAALRVICGVALGSLSVAAILLSPQARRFRAQMAARARLFPAAIPSASPQVDA
jgi:O-antigen/teichoic acid export membrane protein